MVEHDPVVDVFKALGDPVRWDMIQRIAEVDELPCSCLESMLPVTKPTISYHAKILSQAGLVQVRKDGRNSYYRLRREALADLEKDLGGLVSPRSEVGLTDGGSVIAAPEATEQRRHEPRYYVGAAPDDTDPILLTW